MFTASRCGNVSVTNNFMLQKNNSRVFLYFFSATSHHFLSFPLSISFFFQGQLSWLQHSAGKAQTNRCKSQKRGSIPGRVGQSLGCHWYLSTPLIALHWSTYRRHDLVAFGRVICSRMQKVCCLSLLCFRLLVSSHSHCWFYFKLYL